MKKKRFRQEVAPEDVHGELLPGQTPELLKALHILDHTGRLHADSRRKLKQINHLVRLISPAMDDALARHADPLIVDACAGNAYLAFLLHELFLAREDKGRLIAIETRPDLAARVRERADALGCKRLQVIESALEDAELPERPRVLVALHACDTATDDALILAIQSEVEHVAVVPCCQAEVARQLSGKTQGDPTLVALWRHKWHRREFGAHLTNVLRAMVLEAFGYQVTVTELVGWEHSVKNELIVGRRVHKENRKARLLLEDLLERLPEARPKLVRKLGLGKAELQPADTL